MLDTLRIHTTHTDRNTPMPAPTPTAALAGVVNSALKFHTNLLTVRFRERLTNHVHERYCHGTRYYRAATLRSTCVA